MRGVPARGITFMKPGAIYRARFMARLTYALKIFIFRDAGFKLTKRERDSLGNSCVFGVSAYVKAWFLSWLPTSAPAIDWRNLKLLIDIGSPSSLGALKKLCGHLWYLSEELAALALFDSEVDVDEKKAMVQQLSHSAPKDPVKRIAIDQSKMWDKRLSDFVTSNTRNFFEKLSLLDSFLTTNPETWESNSDYLRAEQVVRELRVVNDTAERGVALMQEYNALITKDEEHIQFVLQVVSEHRKLYPDSKKATIVKGLASRSSACTSGTPID